MRTTVQKWGNSLAVRIPKAFAAEANLAEDSAVDVTLVEGKVVVVPVQSDEWTLEALVAQITDENKHGEVDWGKTAGTEPW